MNKMYIIKPKNDNYTGTSVVAAGSCDSANRIINEYIAAKKDNYEGYSNVTEADVVVNGASNQEGILVSGIKHK